MNLTKELRKILQSLGHTAFTPINFGFQRVHVFGVKFANFLQDIVL